MSDERYGSSINPWPWIIVIVSSAVLGVTVREDFWMPAVLLGILFVPIRNFFRDDSAASTPLRIRLNPLRWLLSFPRWPLTFGLVLLGFVLLSVYVHWVFWIPAIPAWLVNVGYWHIIGKKFWGGDANPGLVVSVQPPLVAVATDLSMGFGDYPVVKIVPESLKKAGGAPLSPMLRVATVALYDNPQDENQPYWNTFHPQLLDHGTTNVREVKRVLDSFDDESWAELEEFLKEVPKPYVEGQYRVRVEDSDWKDVDEFENHAADSDEDDDWDD
ncbi:MAG: DUF3239 domain-containing protein [Planctomycetota bacterium]